MFISDLVVPAILMRVQESKIF